MSDESVPTEPTRPTLDDVFNAFANWPEVERILLAWEEGQQRNPRHTAHQLSEQFLMRAIRHPDDRFRALAAEAGNWSQQVMALALGDHYADIRYIAACSEASPPDGLTGLAHDQSIGVRAGVASNRSTPLATLLEMLDDPDERVRHFAVLQQRFPADVMERLSFSDDPVVVCAVALSPNTSPETLHRLASSGSLPPRVWYELASNPNTRAESLECIPTSPRPQLHQLLVTHPNASDALCRRLAAVYLDEPEAPLRLMGLRLMFRGRVKVAPWGEGRIDRPTPGFERPSDVLVWLADGADLSTVLPYALDPENPEWLRWFILSRAQLDEATRERLVDDPEPRIRRLAPSLR